MQDLIARTSVYWRRARGTMGLLGEVLGLVTAVITGAILIRAGASIEVRECVKALVESSIALYSDVAEMLR